MSAHNERCHLFAITNLLIETERPIAIILSHTIRDREAPGIARLMAERSLMKAISICRYRVDDATIDAGGVGVCGGSGLVTR